MWISVWKPLHIYEGCNIHAESQLVPTNQGWEFHIINMHKFKLNVSLVTANQAKKMISSSNKCGLLFLRENQIEGEKKHHLEDFIEAYNGVF
jgi:hypothetical protein